VRYSVQHAIGELGLVLILFLFFLVHWRHAFSAAFVVQIALASAGRRDAAFPQTSAVAIVSALRRLDFALTDRRYAEPPIPPDGRRVIRARPLLRFLAHVVGAFEDAFAIFTFGGAALLILAAFPRAFGILVLPPFHFRRFIFFLADVLRPFEATLPKCGMVHVPHVRAFHPIVPLYGLLTSIRALVVARHRLAANLVAAASFADRAARRSTLAPEGPPTNAFGFL